MNPGGGSCSELRSHHCIPAWVTEWDSVSKKKNKKKILNVGISMETDFSKNWHLNRTPETPVCFHCNCQVTKLFTYREFWETSNVKLRYKKQGQAHEAGVVNSGLWGQAGRAHRSLKLKVFKVKIQASCNGLHLNPSTLGGWDSGLLEAKSSRPAWPTW